MRAFNKYTLIGLLFILAGFGMAKADFTAGDFNLQGDCFKAVFANYEFTNNWTETVTYKLTATGEGAEWVNINGKWIGWKAGTREKAGPLVFTLAPGETKTLYAFFKPCCWTKPGNYVIGLRYSSKKGVKTQKIVFTVLESRKIGLEVKPQTIKVGQCEEADFNIKVTNNSYIGETIQLSVQGFEREWVTLAKSEFRLENNGEMRVPLKIKAPCNQKLGAYLGKVIAKIKGTELLTFKDINLEIVDKQSIEIGKAGQEFKACNDLDEEKTIPITNKGRANDLLQLEAKGPSWISLKEKTLSLKPGETKNVKVLFKSTNSEEKSYSFTVKAVSSTYGKETSRDFTVTVKDCFKLEVQKKTGATETCLEDPLTYEFTIKNLKDKSTTVKISETGLKAKIMPETFTLAPGEEKNVTLNFNLAGEKPGEKTLSLKVEGTNFEFTKSYKLKLNDCYAIKIDYDGLSKTIDVTTGVQICPQEKIVTAKAKNTGTKPQELTLKVSGTKWILIEPQKLSLKPGEEKEFYAYFIPLPTTKEGEYTATLEASAHDFSEKAILRAKVKTVGLGEKIDISAESEIEKEIVETQRTIKAKIHLKNTGNCVLAVKGISAQGFEASFEPETFNLDINEEKTITATVFLGEKSETQEFSMPISIETDRGTISKTLKVSVEKESATMEETPTPTQKTPVAKTAEKTMKITTKIKLSNTRKEKLVVESITAKDFNAKFEPSSFELDTNAEQEILVTVTLSKETKGKITMPITIHTSKGTIKKEITVNAGETSKAGITSLTALSAGTVNTIILLFLAIVAVIIMVLAWHAYKKPTTQKKKAK